MDEYEYVVVNDDLERAVASVGSIVDAEVVSRERVKNLRQQVGLLIERLEQEIENITHPDQTSHASFHTGRDRQARRQQVPRRPRGGEVCARAERVPGRLGVARQEAHDALARGAGAAATSTTASFPAVVGGVGIGVAPSGLRPVIFGAP